MFLDRPRNRDEYEISKFSENAAVKVEKSRVLLLLVERCTGLEDFPIVVQKRS